MPFLLFDQNYKMLHVMHQDHIVVYKLVNMPKKFSLQNFVSLIQIKLE